MEYYKINQNLGGDEYATNIRKLRKNLINGFLRRIKIEKRKLIGIKRESKSSPLKQYKVKKEEEIRLSKEGKVNYNKNLITLEQKIFEKLKDTDEEVKKQIQIEHDWFVLEDMSSHDIKNAKEPMHLLLKPVDPAVSVSTAKLTVSSKFGLDLIQDISEPQYIACSRKLKEVKREVKKEYPQVEEENEKNASHRGQIVLKVNEFTKQEIFEKERIAN